MATTKTRTTALEKCAKQFFLSKNDKLRTTKLTSEILGIFLEGQVLYPEFILKRNRGCNKIWVKKFNITRREVSMYYNIEPNCFHRVKGTNDVNMVLELNRVERLGTKWQ